MTANSRGFCRAALGWSARTLAEDGPLCDQCHRVRKASERTRRLTEATLRMTTSQMLAPAKRHGVPGGPRINDYGGGF